MEAAIESAGSGVLLAIDSPGSGTERGSQEVLITSSERSRTSVHRDRHLRTRTGSARPSRFPVPAEAFSVPPRRTVAGERSPATSRTGAT